MLKSGYILLFISLLNQSVFSQNATNLFFHLDKITLKEKVVSDSTNNYSKYTEKAYNQFALNGYIGITPIDTIKKGNGLHYYFKAEKHFSKIILENSNKYKNQETKTSTYFNAEKSLDAELKYLENNGFPFAHIDIFEQIEDENSLTLRFKIDSGNYYRIDKIHIKSEHKIHDKTLFNVIGIKPGDIYNEKKIANIPSLLSSSNLYKIIRPSQLLFTEETAELYLYVAKEKSSNADGYIGFQQDQETKKLVLNGYINLALFNSFNRAEIIDLRWKSNPDKTQDFRGKIEYPFLFNTPLGIGSELELRKQDTTFLRTDIQFNLSYNHPISKFTIFDQIESSSVLRESAPAEYRNYRKNTIGASLLIKPPKIEFAHFYHPQIFLLGGFYNYRDDTIDDNKSKISNRKYEIGYSHRIDFLKSFHINNTIQFQGLGSNIALSRNELIYFGGLNSVRGFYELELSGNDVWIFKNELEFTPVDLISIFILYDYSTYKLNGLHHTNSAGFGFGLNNKNTRLEIVVANGVLDSNPLDFTNTKIHLGFKSTF